MSKKHRYNDRFRSTPQATSPTVAPKSRAPMPIFVGVGLFVVVLIGAWLLMGSDTPQSSTSSSTTDDALSVEQGGSTNGASDQSSDLLQGTGDQPLDGSSGAEIQNSVGGEETTNSSELLKQIEAGDVDITVEESTDSDSNIKVE
jgi:hypothetical protein